VNPCSTTHSIACYRLRLAGKPSVPLGLTGLAWLEVRAPAPLLTRPVAWFGLLVSVLSWGRGIGSATGWYFLEPLIYGNVPAFLWLGYYGMRIAAEAKRAQ
jgi:hypothetical protein